MTGNGKANGSPTIRELLDQGVVLKAAQLGVQRALRIRKALGNPIVREENGKAILVPPDQIQLEETPPPLFSNVGLS